MKRYKIVKGVGFNDGAITIESNSTKESAIFISKVRKKAVELFGVGLSLDTISTSYSVSFRHTDANKNKKMAKILIKVVELEEELLKLKNI